MVGIMIQLIRYSGLSLHRFGLGFLVSNAWNPVTGNFGAASSILGTLASTAIAMILALPISIFIAMFLAELAPPFISKPVGYAIRLLAAIPSIIYGMWGLFVAPFMADHVQPFLAGFFVFVPLFQGPPMGIGMLSAGIILALMILPFISAVMRDIFRMVPTVVKEAGYGVGSSTWEVTRYVTIPYGFSGMVGASFLGLGRALGETMAVTFVIGNNHSFSLSLFAAGNTIASTMANEFTEATSPLYVSSLVELGLILFGITLIIQVLAHFWLKQIRASIRVALIHRSSKIRNLKNLTAKVVATLCALLGIFFLGWVLLEVVQKGANAINWSFFTMLPPPPGHETGGVANAILGTLEITLLATVIAVPIRVLAGTYLWDVRTENRLGSSGSLCCQFVDRNSVNHCRPFRLCLGRCADGPILGLRRCNILGRHNVSGCGWHIGGHAQSGA